MECWKTKCVKCGKMIPANECPQVGVYDGEKYQNSLCKPCWSESEEEKRNFYIQYRDGLRINNLTFNESWDMFTEVLGSDNPCSVFRQHEEMRVDH